MMLLSRVVWSLLAIVLIACASIAEPVTSEVPTTHNFLMQYQDKWDMLDVDSEAFSPHALHKLMYDIEHGWREEASNPSVHGKSFEADSTFNQRDPGRYLAHRSTGPLPAAFREKLYPLWEYAMEQKPAEVPVATWILGVMLMESPDSIDMRLVREALLRPEPPSIERQRRVLFSRAFMNLVRINTDESYDLLFRAATEPFLDPATPLFSCTKEPEVRKKHALIAVRAVLGRGKRERVLPFIKRVHRKLQEERVLSEDTQLRQELEHYLEVAIKIDSGHPNPFSKPVE